MRTILAYSSLILACMSASAVRAQIACCTPGGCVNVADAAACNAMGGFNVLDCNNCQRGACCAYMTNACTFVTQQFCPVGHGTIWVGPGTTCDYCTGACCDTLTGQCYLAAPQGCASGPPVVRGSTCTGFPCASVRACCVAAGSCSLTTQAACSGPGQTWRSSETACTAALCTNNGQCPFSFSPGLTYGTGVAPLSTALGDFNGDGRLDLVVAAQASDIVTVQLGAGTGQFQGPAAYSVGGEPYFVAVADLNADGRLDIVTANHATGNVSVLRGNGDGSFQAVVHYAAGSGPICVAVGDLNGDGRPDLAVVNQFSNNVSILLGNPAPNLGTFLAAAGPVSVGDGPTAVAIGDFNRDGRADMAVTVFDANAISILRGNGDATFQLTDLFSSGSGVTGPRAIVALDLNNDGRIDIATANYLNNTISVNLQSSSGSLAAGTVYPVGLGPHSIAAGDVDNDGLPDLVLADSASNQITILTGQAAPNSGAFRLASTFNTGAGPTSVALGDLNFDGRRDLVVANGSGSNVSVFINRLGFPSITRQPTRVTARSGQSASFSVGVNSPVVGYQWRRDGVDLNNGGPLSGVDTAALTINPVALADSGAAFECRIYDACNTIVETIPAGLNVTSRCLADFNQSGVVSVQDVFDFLGAYFAGCP